jgi:hypothetical protein
MVPKWISVPSRTVEEGIVEHSGPYVLLGTDDNGRPVEVGIFDNEAAMRLHAARHTRDGCRYSVWTPRLNETIATASVRGLSVEK